MKDDIKVDFTEEIDEIIDCFVDSICGEIEGKEIDWEQNFDYKKCNEEVENIVMKVYKEGKSKAYGRALLDILNKMKMFEKEYPANPREAWMQLKGWILADARLHELAGDIQR